MTGPPVLSVLPDNPFPAATGLQLRLEANLRVVRALAEQSFVLCFRQPGAERDEAALADIVDEVVDAGSPVDYARFSVQERVGHRLGYVAHAALRRRARRYPLALTYDAAGGEAAVKAAARRLAPEFVLLPIWFAHYAPGLEAEGFRVILDGYDVLTDQTLNMAKTYGRRHPARLPGLLANHAATRSQERLFLPTCSEIWANSKAQASRFGELSPGTPVVVIGNVLDEQAIQVTPPPGNGAVGFIGAYGYPPNLAAAEHLAFEVFPHVHARLPASRLLLAGGGMDHPTQAKLGALPGVELLGRVPDSGEFMASCDVMAFPVFFESGPPLKVVEALARGRPVVASPQMASALELSDGRDALVAGEPRAAADALIRVLSDRSLSGSLAAEGRRVFEERFSLGVTLQEARRTSVMVRERL